MLFDDFRGYEGESEINEKNPHPPILNLIGKLYSNFILTKDIWGSHQSLYLFLSLTKVFMIVLSSPPLILSLSSSWTDWNRPKKWSKWSKISISVHVFSLKWWSQRSSDDWKEGSIIFFSWGLRTMTMRSDNVDDDKSDIMSMMMLTKHLDRLNTPDIIQNWKATLRANLIENQC